MTLPSAHSTTTTLRTVSVASEPGTATLLSQNQLGITGGATLRTVGVSPAQFSSVQYVNGSMDGTALHGNVRYLVPVNMQRASESYVVVNQAPQMLTPVYLQNVQNVQRVSVSSMDETDTIQQVNINGQASVFSQPSSPIKSPEPPE
ncbi:protein POF1B, partial [Tachysurus ichikawai]